MFFTMFLSASDKIDDVTFTLFGTWNAPLMNQQHTFWSCLPLIISSFCYVSVTPRPRSDVVRMGRAWDGRGHMH